MLFLPTLPLGFLLDVGLVDLFGTVHFLPPFACLLFPLNNDNRPLLQFADSLFPLYNAAIENLS